MVWRKADQCIWHDCRDDSGATCVLDVRDEDFRGGHIRGCLNIWSENFYEDEDVDALIQKHGLTRYKQVVVTCFMSQQRGPFCAKRCSASSFLLQI